MEKISKIIPPSGRTRAIEISDAQPARPGAPAMGRVMGRVTPRSFSQDFPQGFPTDTVSIGEQKGPDFPTYKNLKDVKTLNQGLDRSVEREPLAPASTDEMTDKPIDKSRAKDAQNAKTVENLQRKFFMGEKDSLDEAKGEDAAERVTEAVLAQNSGTKKKQPLTLFDSSDLRKTALKEKEAHKEKSPETTKPNS